jgi:hypothetical protein
MSRGILSGHEASKYDQGASDRASAEINPPEGVVGLITTTLMVTSCHSQSNQYVRFAPKHCFLFFPPGSTTVTV